MSNKILKKRLLIEILILTIMLIVILVIKHNIAKAWSGDPSDPHVLMGSQLIQRSIMNRLMN